MYEKLCEEWRRRDEERRRQEMSYGEIPAFSRMAIAPGGRMRQKIYNDPYGLDAWDQRHASRCYVTITNSAQWMAITGKRPPTKPPTAKRYTEAGLPWFTYYGGDTEAMAGAKMLWGLVSVVTKLRSLGSMATMGGLKGKAPLPDNESLEVEHIIALRKAGAGQVREMPA